MPILFSWLASPANLLNSDWRLLCGKHSFRKYKKNPQWTVFVGVCVCVWAIVGGSQWGWRGFSVNKFVSPWSKTSEQPLAWQPRHLVLASGPWEQQPPVSWTATVSVASWSQKQTKECKSSQMATSDLISGKRSADKPRRQLAALILQDIEFAPFRGISSSHCFSITVQINRQLQEWQISPYGHVVCSGLLFVPERKIHYIIWRAAGILPKKQKSCFLCFSKANDKRQWSSLLVTWLGFTR